MSRRARIGSTIAIVAGITLSASAATAATFRCVEPLARAGGAKTYQVAVRFGSEGSIARLKVFGERAPRTLRCTPALPRKSGSFRHLLTCGTVGGPDAGYFVLLLRNRRTAQTFASVVAKNFMGDRPVAQLRCRNIPR